MPDHPPILMPVAPAALRAVLPDDPGVAFRLATELLDDDRKMFNHHRGLWGYSGSGRDGQGPLLIQSTGVGGPSAALVLAEVASAGVRFAVRAGTARSDGVPESGQLFAATSVIGDTGAEPLDGELGARLGALADAAGPVRSTHLPGRPGDAPAGGAVDLETASMVAVARGHSVRFAAILAISGDGRTVLDHEQVAAATARAGVAAAQALSLYGRPAP